MVRTATTLSYDEAETFYDRMGRRQDTQGFYEDIALDELVAHGRLEEAHDILELGCGTGRLAERLLREVLPDDARYVGLDVSSTMLHIARERLSPFGERARVDKTEGSLALPCPDGSFDRVVATYVADLLSNDDIDLFLSESWRVLRPGGLFASAGLTRGERLPSRLVSSLWSAVHRLSPRLVGGCRPVVLAERLDSARFRVVHRRVVTGFAIPSEVLVAEKRPST